MVPANNNVQNLLYNIKYSSVVPASVTKENTIKELTFMDIVMKLHYIRGVYFFTRSAVQELNIKKFKEPMFLLLDLCNITSGRIRRSEETGKLFIKCNDSGVRIVEAQTDKTVHEWLEMKDISNVHSDYLAFNQVLGPELGFSPLVFIQFTRFKCGGLSIGLSWAHALGDALAASNFINLWGEGMAGSLSTKSLEMPKSYNETMKDKIKPSNAAEEEPVSVRKVEPVRDHWVVANNCKMEAFSFQISASQLDHICGFRRDGALRVEAEWTKTHLCKLHHPWNLQPRSGFGSSRTRKCPRGWHPRKDCYCDPAGKPSYKTERRASKGILYCLSR